MLMGIKNNLDLSRKQEDYWTGLKNSLVPEKVITGVKSDNYWDYQISSYMHFQDALK